MIYNITPSYTWQTVLAPPPASQLSLRRSLELLAEFKRRLRGRKLKAGKRQKEGWWSERLYGSSPYQQFLYPRLYSGLPSWGQIILRVSTLEQGVVCLSPEIQCTHVSVALAKDLLTALELDWVLKCSSRTPVWASGLGLTWWELGDLVSKIRLIKALVWPVATYGCESGTLRKNEETRLDAFEMKWHI